MNTCKGQMLITFQHIVQKGWLKISSNSEQKKELASCRIENTNFVSLNINQFSGDFLLNIEADGNLIQKQIHL